MLDTLQPLLDYTIRHPEQVAGLATGLGATATHYAKTGRFPIGRLPYRALRDAWGELADQYFGSDRPTGVPGLVLQTDLDTLETALRDEHWESPDDVSFEYDGEVLNLRRPNGTREHPDTGEPIPMEIHVRVFETASGNLLAITHDEASRLEAWGPHIRGTMLSWERGQTGLANVLDDVGLYYEAIASERAAGIEVV